MTVGKLKERHVPVIRALHNDCRRFPGGITHIAALIGAVPKSLANRLNPNMVDCAPSLAEFLDVLEIVRSIDTVRAIATSVECSVIDEHVPPSANALDGFRSLTKEFADVLAEGSADLADGRFDAAERLRMIAELDEAIASAQQMRAFLAGV